MSNRLVMRTERVSIASPGVSQVLTTSQVLTWSVEVTAETTNQDALVIGNDGNDTVSSTTGVLLYPGKSKVFNANDFFSPYECYINMSKIFIFSPENGIYRLLYWTGSNGD